MIQIKKFVFSPFEENTYVLYNDDNIGFIVDPGCFDKDEINEIDKFIETQKIKIQFLFNTHCHLDHVFGNEHIIKKYNIKLIAHKLEVPILNNFNNACLMFGITANTIPPPIDTFISENETLKLGDDEFTIIHVPGHSPGSICLINYKQKFVISGDTLFKESIGRTDLPLGNHNDLIKNIKEKLFSLNEDFEVYPGHGYNTTIGYEKTNNLFLI